MKKEKLKFLLVPSIYLLAIFIFGFTLYLGQKLFNKEKFDDNIEFVDNEILIDNLYIPVVSDLPTVMKPILKDDISIKYYFYNEKDNLEKQEKSIIFYEDSYLQSTGISYTSKEKFDVISILDGKVISIEDNALLGKTIKIQHDNNLTSIYQSLSETSLKVDDIVLRGQVIGFSGNSKLYNNDFNLHFELINQGVNVNPEEYYNKTIDEISN